MFHLEILSTNFINQNHIRFALFQRKRSICYTHSPFYSFKILLTELSLELESNVICQFSFWLLDNIHPIWHVTPISFNFEIDIRFLIQPLGKRAKSISTTYLPVAVLFIVSKNGYLYRIKKRLCHLGPFNVQCFYWTTNYSLNIPSRFIKLIIISLYLFIKWFHILTILSDFFLTLLI